MRRIASLCLAATLLCMAGAAQAQYADAEDHYVFRVQITDKTRELPLLAGMHLDVAGNDWKQGTLDFYGAWNDFHRLKDAGFDPVVVWSSRDQASEALSDYLDPNEVAARLDSYQAGFPSLAKKVQIATTSEGRPVFAMKVSDNVATEEDEPVVFLDCQHHAREVMAPEICVDAIDYLLNRYTLDPQVKAWVDGREIWIIPCINPDGTNTVFTSDTGWRKNRRNNGDGSFGVDINRNYPFDWGACGGSSGSGSAEDYRGTAPSSEPETTGYVALAQTHRPSLAVSYHSYGEDVIHPYGCDTATTPEFHLLRDLSSDLASRIVGDGGSNWYAYGTSSETLGYLVDGGMKDWFYGALGAPAWTIEINGSSQGFQPDYAAWRASTVLRERPGWQYLLDRVTGPAIYGHVTDACTGAPLVATVGIDELVYSHGESPRLTEAGYGRFQRVASAGSYHLRPSKTGYATQVWPVEVGTKAARRDAKLVPTGSYAADIYSVAIADGGGDGDGQADPGESVTMSVKAYATGGALSGLAATLSTSDPYVNITDASSSWPAIAAGGTANPLDTFAFEVSRFAPEGHVITFTIAFTAGQALCSATASFDVRVTRSVPVCPFVNQPLNTNPGWTIQNTNAQGWAFGAPGGSGGTGGPTAAHTGSFVYGTNLAGSYGSSSDYKLTTLPLDLSGLQGAELRFWRWLNSETGADLSSVELSTDGVNFTKVWSGFGRDTAWGEYRLDISSLADGKPTVYVRFRQQSDGSTNESGFYIDDVSICGDTVAPSASMKVASWSISDGVTASCTDGDPYPDAGETVDMTVNFRNDGNAGVSGLVVTLSTSDPNIVLITSQATLGNVPAAGTASAVFRYRVANTVSCLEQAPFTLDFSGNAGDYVARDSSVLVRLQADNGTPVADALDTFETTTLWTLTGEWQISRPRGKGGAGTVDGNGGPDPAAAFGGIRVLGVDLIGAGASLGNYENNLGSAITATSPSYDCTNSHNVHVQFKRWLGVEGSQFDHATVQAWDGANWQVVWANPSDDLSDLSWQSVDYDVSQYADGNPAFKVRFTMSSNGTKVFCGWNIDDLRITNGYTPQVCETGTCPIGCASVTEISGVGMTRTASTSTLTWSPSADSCHSLSGTGYHVYRGTNAAPRIATPVLWPGDSYFGDVTALDADANPGNASYTETQAPAAGQVFFYLVADVGTNGAEGPKGWQGM